MSNEVYGVGWAFPFQFNENGRVKITADQSDGNTSDVGQLKHLRGAISQIIGVAWGERFMRGDYGCGVHEVVFDPNDESLVANVLYYVGEAVDTWDQRVEAQDIDAIQEEGVLKAIIEFMVKKTNEINSLVLPLEGD